jgi:RNA polymerase sigma-70 factor (ECF subfamily)
VACRIVLNNIRHRDTIPTYLMGYLRLVHVAPSVPAPPKTCLEVFDAELDYLFETLRRMGANARETEDFAQEIFVVLHRNWPNIDTTRPMRPYLFGVAFRIVCAQRRRRAREVPFAALEAEDAGAGPEGLVQKKETVALLRAALERVPLARRAVLILHDLDGVAIADVAKKLSVSRFGAYARLRKGRRELAAAVRRLSKDGPEDARS